MHSALPLLLRYVWWTRIRMAPQKLPQVLQLLLKVDRNFRVHVRKELRQGRLGLRRGILQSLQYLHVTVKGQHSHIQVINDEPAILLLPTGTIADFISLFHPYVHLG